MRFIKLILLPLTLFISQHNLAAQEVSKEFTKTYNAYNRAYSQGDVARVAELAKKALDLAKRDIGASHNKIPILEVNLAHALILQRKMQAAEPILNSAKAGIIKHYGNDDLNLVTVYADMAKIFASKKELENSRKELSKAIAIIAKKHGGDHPQIAELMIQQATLDLAGNNIEAAEEMYEKVLAIFAKKYGENSLHSANIISQQGDIELLKKDFKNAEQKYLTAHQIYADKLLEDDNIVLASHSRLAKLYIALRDQRFASHADTVIQYAPNEDGAAAPLYVMRPKYPIFKDGTKPQGWVLLEFDVDTKGRVLKPKIVESRPATLFDKVSLDVTPSWRFKPKVIEGVRLTQKKTRVRLVFKKDNIEVYFGEAKIE